MSAIERSTQTSGQQPRLVSEFVLKLTPFDGRDALRLVDARGETMRRLLAKLIPELKLSTALDSGCGVGFFSEMMQECGLQVRGFDGRAQNVAEARRRFPEIPFEQSNVEDPAIRNEGVSTLCCALDCYITWKIHSWRCAICGRLPASACCWKACACQARKQKRCCVKSRGWTIKA